VQLGDQLVDLLAVRAGIDRLHERLLDVVLVAPDGYTILA